MRSDSIEKVKNALGSRTMTLRELGKTGLSRNTIASALTWLGAEAVEDSYPVQYRMPPKAANTGKSTIGTPSITSAKLRVQVELVEHDDWALRWNMARLAFAQEIGDLVLDPHLDPKQLAKQFATAAKSLASVGYAIDKVMSMPDWFTLLGGNIEQDQVH